MTDLLSEELISLTKLAQELKKHATTVWRWTRRGLRGVCLERISIGGQSYTSREAFARFVATTNGGKPTTSQTPRQRLLEIAAAERQLDGLLATTKARRPPCG